MSFKAVYGSIVINSADHLKIFPFLHLTLASMPEENIFDLWSFCNTHSFVSELYNKDVLDKVL